jgi:hypothetical protein
MSPEEIERLELEDGIRLHQHEDRDLEVKARNQLDSAEVLAKRNAATQWCQRASDYHGASMNSPRKRRWRCIGTSFRSMTIERQSPPHGSFQD